MTRTFVIGVGMTKFERFGKREDWEYPEIAKEAIEEALKDSELGINDIEAAVASYCYGDSCCGHRGLREVGLTGIPVFNVNSNCSSGSSALYLANTFLKSGKECMLAFGFEKMERGLSMKYPNFPQPTAPHYLAHDDLIEKLNLPPINKHPKLNEMTSGAMTMFTSAGLEYMRKYNVSKEVLTKIAHKNHLHSVYNAKACFNQEFTYEQITNPKMQLTDLIYSAMAGPTADGGAAAVLVTESYLNKNPHLKEKAVEILDMEMLSDTANFNDSFANIVGLNLAKEGVNRIFKRQNQYSIKDVSVIELHDCFTPNEFLLYEALGLCDEGKAEKLVMEEMKMIQCKGKGRLMQFKNQVVVNPSGGLVSKGHPLGATGLAQCYELCNQLRSKVEPERQVPNPKLALQHNVGIGTSCVLFLYKKYLPLTKNHSLNKL
ncbi:thiolase [Neoconidiobolus thromboides FSU 785]|nr:thiolase [Neoconidiobolus thromboides FSU 785]